MMYRAQEANAALSFTEAITPYLPLITSVLGFLIVGAFALWNRKRGAIETRAPDVNEIWQKQAADSMALDGERRVRRLLEDMIYELRKLIWDIVGRVHSGGDVTLTTREIEVLNKPLPSVDDKKD